jgi:hypothetical protein
LLKEKEGKKLAVRWYYIDIEKALNPDVEREDAIVALPSSRIKSGFGINGTIDCSTEEKEYDSMMFPVNKVFQYSTWRSGYSKFWNYDPVKLALIDRFELEVIKKFEHYQMPIIQLRPELPKEAICKIFEKINTISSELNFFDLATAIYAAEDFSLRDDWEQKALRLKRFRVLNSCYLSGIQRSLSVSILLTAIVSAILVFLIFMTRHNFFMAGTRADKWTKNRSKVNR